MLHTVVLSIFIYTEEVLPPPHTRLFFFFLFFCFEFGRSHINSLLITIPTNTKKQHPHTHAPDNNNNNQPTNQPTNQLTNQTTTTTTRRLARDVFYTVATHTCLSWQNKTTTKINQQTNKQTKKENDGSSHGRVFATFKRRVLTNRRRNQMTETGVCSL